ncbi:MAG: alanine:cation symporter family protein [Bacteroidales bacterium]|nr:alanine:cation symporter family protein [Bacteroidales bacterium]
MVERIASTLNDIIWSPALVILLVGAGLYFSFRTGFVQIRCFGLMVRALFAPAHKEEDGAKRGISSFEAFCIALSGRVGTGNIVGVATAIALGGPGSVFWMWVIAFLGASTAFVESTLSQLFKFHHASGYRGGPACYIEQGLKKRGIGVLFAILTMVGYGILLPAVQANGVSGALVNSFHISPLAAGIGVALLLALVIVGGIKSIARVASIITPFMALGYIIFAIIVIFSHLDAIPGVFLSIFSGAFGIQPVAGGILGSTIMMGIKRGIFSNEAGQGGGAIVSASAAVSHPARQGLAQAFSVYVDTLLVCTATALMILCSGTYNILDARTGEILVGSSPELGANYVGFTQAAVDTVWAGFGSSFVSIALLFFAFTTLMAYYFYTESSIIYLFSKKKDGSKPEKFLIWTSRFVLLGMVVFGAGREANVIWQLGDIGVGLTAWINVLALLLLCPYAIRALREYESEQKKP